MKKMRKIMIAVILIEVVFTCFFIINSYAVPTLSELINDTKNVSNIPSSSKFKDVFSIIISIIRYAGSGIAVISVMIMGIKYMVASSGNKAEYKKKLIPMGIGAALLFSAAQIIGIVGNIAMSLNT